MLAAGRPIKFARLATSESAAVVAVAAAEESAAAITLTRDAEEKQLNEHQAKVRLNALHARIVDVGECRCLIALSVCSFQWVGVVEQHQYEIQLKDEEHRQSELLAELRRRQAEEEEKMAAMQRQREAEEERARCLREQVERQQAEVEWVQQCGFLHHILFCRN